MTVNGERFFFLYDEDSPEELHITASHGASPLDAVQTFFDGETVFNEQRRRHETSTNNMRVYRVRPRTSMPTRSSTPTRC
ncbi:MAG: hypothetical protein ACYDAG_16100 [Chloroflexota bacterium]